MVEPDPPWLKSRDAGPAVYWRWECPKCGATGVENAARGGAVLGYTSHVRKAHPGDSPPSR